MGKIIIQRSIFRLGDALGLFAVYMICFSVNLILNYIETLEINSYMLKKYFDMFLEHKVLIILLNSSIVIFFQYQMLNIKKNEIFCRILVGDTTLSIACRYFVCCLTISLLAYVVNVIISLCLNFNILKSIYIIFIYFIYMLIYTGKIYKYENI